MKTLLYSNQLHGLKALSEDKAIGTIDEFYFDDQSWKIRYCVLDVGTWLTGRKVLVSPAAIGKCEWDNKGIIIKATKEQIRNSPEADTELPVARALEVQIHRHFGWEYSWPEIFLGEKDVSGENENNDHDPHLRSTKVLTDIAVVTEEGKSFGTIIDFLIDPETWSIAFAAVNRVKSTNFLLSTECIRNIDVAIREIRIVSPW
jgi:hypothetical protein